MSIKVSECYNTEKDILTLIGKFLKDFYPNEKDVLLCGSFSINGNYHFKDIDLLIISREIVGYGETKIDYKEIIFHVVILPRLHLLQTIANDYYTIHKSARFNMLREGVALESKTQPYKKFISSLTSKKFIDLNTSIVLARKRNVITELLETLENEESEEMFLFGFNQVFKLLIDLNNNISFPGYVQTQKKVFVKSKDLENSIFNNYSKTLKNLVNNGDKSMGIDFLESELNKFGGRLKTVSSNEILLNVIENQLVIKITLPKYNSKAINNFLSSNLAKSLSETLEKENYYFTLKGVYGIHPLGIYVVVNAEKKVILEKILPELNQLNFLNAFRNQGVNLKYPYNLNLSEGIEFGGANNYIAIMDSFCLFSNLQLKSEKVISTETVIHLIVALSLSIGKLSEFDIATFLAKIKYYAESHIKQLNTDNEEMDNLLESMYNEKALEWIQTNKQSVDNFIDENFLNLNFTSLKEDYIAEFRDLLFERFDEIWFSEPRLGKDFFEVSYIEELMGISLIHIRARTLVLYIIINIFKKDE